MPTVKEVSQGLISGDVSFEQALDLLNGVPSTTIVRPLVNPTGEQLLSLDSQDPPTPDDNDVLHLAVAHNLGAITYGQLEQLANVMT